MNIQDEQTCEGKQEEYLSIETDFTTTLIDTKCWTKGETDWMYITS